MFYLRKQHNYRNESEGEGDSGGGEAETKIEDAAPSEVEEKALKMGWTPKDQFKGDPAKWRPADEFVERGENMLPIVKATVKRQAQEIEELKKSMREFSEYHSKTEQRAYEKAVKELKQKQFQAAADGNADAFVQIDQEIAELSKEVAARPQPQHKLPPEYIEWASRNKWVDNDKKMLAYAEAQGEYLKKTNPELAYVDLLEEVTKAVKKEFPDKFTNPRRESAPSVEGSSAPVKKGNGKSYADMPADARIACDKMVKNYGIKKEDYVKNYFEEA